MSGEARVQMAVMAAIKDRCLTMDELEGETGLTRKQISNGAQGLILGGHAERVARGCFQLTELGKHSLSEGMIIKSGPRGPHATPRGPNKRDTLRQRAWNAMRMNPSGTFTIEELVLVSIREGDKNPVNNLQKYCNFLHRAGYLFLSPVRAASTKLTSNGFKRYRLVKNTGTVAPAIRHSKGCIFDHNTGEEVSYE